VLEGNKGVVTSIAFSPDGNLLAAGDVRPFSTLVFFHPNTLFAQSSGKIVLFDVKERKVVLNVFPSSLMLICLSSQTIDARWSFHSGRINALNWTADGQHCASGSLDTHVYIWSVQKPMKNIAIKNAGPGGVNSVLWIGETTLASAGADACVRIWEIQFHV
jgi:WD repeat-containing protein 1 (actin-interacting protein 1)